ncbi:KRAB-A domain-containing protein 2 [Trichonephila clavipes]|nr:KRAB-A domain-containing protein 2 [Trichonephila clavipes]
MKHSAPKKAIVLKPMISYELNSRYQVDLIDLQSNRDGEYKFLMAYEDHLTKFVQLRPLKTKRAEELAYHIRVVARWINAYLLGTGVILDQEGGSPERRSAIALGKTDVRHVHKQWMAGVHNFW